MLRRIYYTHRRWLLQLPTFSPTCTICITRHWYVRDLRFIIMTLKQNTSNMSEKKCVQPSVCLSSLCLFVSDCCLSLCPSGCLSARSLFVCLFVVCLSVCLSVCVPLYIHFSLVRSWSIKAFNRTLHNVCCTGTYWRHDTMLLLMIIILATMISIWILLMMTITIAIITIAIITTITTIMILYVIYPL